MMNVREDMPLALAEVSVEERAHDPLWYKDAVIYQLHVKSFADSNNDGVGDFPGLIGKLDYLAELGIKATDLSSMSDEQKARVALEVFYLILRDAGRAQTAGTGTYSTGTDAITSLFGTSHTLGDINTRSRTIVR